MEREFYDLAGVRIFHSVHSAASEHEATELINEAWNHQAQCVVIPAEEFGEDFWRLETRIAGGVFQKFVQYKMRLVILGDISERTAASRSLRDFVYEVNRGNAIWFVSSREELESRLSAG